MKEEIESAAEFLAKLLKMGCPEITGVQSDGFRTAIAKLLSEHFTDHWFPHKPNKGSGYRCLRINHNVDPLISKAVNACGTLRLECQSLFPNELTIWIDPREVAYRIGENGSICVLYNTDDEESLPPSPSSMSSSTADSSSDSDLDSSPSPSGKKPPFPSSSPDSHLNHGINVFHPFPTPPSSPPTVQGFLRNNFRHPIPSNSSCRKDLNLYWNSVNSGGVSDSRTAAMFCMEQIAPYVTS